MPVRLMYSIRAQTWGAPADRGFACPLITQRDYRFFAALAGVRGDGPEAKGLPNDINPATAYWLERWGGDHTPSWYPIDEFCAIWMKTRDDGEIDDFIKKYPVSSLFYIDGHNDEEYRVIFNFDS